MHAEYLCIFVGPTMLSVVRSSPTGWVLGRSEGGDWERTLAHVSGAGGRPVARACNPQSAERARSVHVNSDLNIPPILSALSGRHDVRRHELCGPRAPRDDGQHPRRGRRHHLLHVQDQQRDPAAQVAPQTEVGNEGGNGRARLGEHRILFELHCCPGLVLLATVTCGRNKTGNKIHTQPNRPPLVFGRILERKGMEKREGLFSLPTSSINFF